jgi:hypothetical protein
METYDKPLAIAGLISYRCRTPSGFAWIMIGARDHDDAMQEARRSNPLARREDLQVWDDQKYVPASC